MNERDKELAEQAGLLGPSSRVNNAHESAEKFADLIRADMREACAKVCDWIQEKAEFHGTDCCKFPTPTDCAHAIRAMGNT